MTTETVVFPDQNDLDGAAKALLRVQQTYGLETSELADGKIFGANRVLSLSGKIYSIIFLSIHILTETSLLPYMRLVAAKGQYPLYSTKCFCLATHKLVFPFFLHLQGAGKSPRRNKSVRHQAEAHSDGPFYHDTPLSQGDHS